MKSSHCLIRPTVDLFLYDLAEGLGQGQKSVSESRKQFWRRIYGSQIEDKDKLEELEQIEIEQTKAKGAEYIPISIPSFQAFEKSFLYGYYHPLKLGDVYTLHINSFYKQDSEQVFSPQSVDCLLENRQNIFEHLNGQPYGTVGQSWFVWGQLVDLQQEPAATAQSCYTELKLFSNSTYEKDLYAQGKWFGADWFEFWRPSNEQNSYQSCHLIVCLFPADVDISIVNKHIKRLYTHLIQLCRYRNKILWAYRQSRQLKSNLKVKAQTIQNLVCKLPQHIKTPQLELKQLQQHLAQALTVLSDYDRFLSSLEEQEESIKVNIGNYEKRIRIIASKDDTSKLDKLEKFSTLVKEKYLPQIESDRASLSPRLRLLENAIKTVESTIAIEQTKSDRRFNEVIALAGIGLATSQVASAVILANPPQSANPFTFRTEVFLWSLGIGVAGVLIAKGVWELLKLLRHRYY